MADTNAPRTTLLARLARVADATLQRVERIEASANAAPAGLAAAAPATARKSPLLAVWNSMETIARRLIDVEKAQPDMLDLIAELEARIIRLEADRKEGI